MKGRAVLLIFLVTIIVYSNSLGGTFLYDDEYFITMNINIRNLKNAPSFFTNRSAVAFADLSHDVYRPITTLSYSIDYALWKLNTFGYHLSNVLFHALNAILLFLFLCIVLENVPIALFASLFFACHPIQTEVVSWISGRSSVLFLFFYLLSLILYALFLKIPKKIYLAGSLASCAISLFSKEMAVTLPLVLIAYDIHFSGRDSFRKKVSRYAPFFLLLLFFLFTRGAVLKRVSQCGWWGGNPYYTFLSMSKVFLEYMRLLLLPVNQCAFYLADISTSIAETKVLVSLALFGSLAAALPLIFKRSKRISFAIWWFFITILPVSNIVPLKALMAERFLYIPSIGYCIILAALAYRAGSVKYFKRDGKALAWLAVSCLVAAYSVGTMARNEDWADPIAMSRSILRVQPLNPWAFVSSGVSYMAMDRFDDAEKQLRKAIALSKDYAAAKNALGFCYLKMERYKDAQKLLEETLALKPESIEAMNSLGIAYAKDGKLDEAIKEFEASLMVDPTHANAYLNLGSAYEEKRQYDKALEAYGEISIHTNSRQEIAISYIRIGDVYIKLSDREKAGYYYDKALAASGARGLEDLKKIVEDRLRLKWRGDR